MTARELWSGYYWHWRRAVKRGLRPVTIKSRRMSMTRFVREAALERKLAAQQRKIDELRATLIVICEEYRSDSEVTASARHMYKLAQAGIKNAGVENIQDLTA